MKCTVRAILDIPFLEKATLLAGHNSIDNIVNRLSVFDCPVKETIFGEDIIEHGDLFISGLDQFKQAPEMFQPFIDLLIDNRCSALIITDENPGFVTQDIIKKCDESGLPIIMVNHNIPYANILDAINKLFVHQYFHAINGRKLDSLKNKSLNVMEKKKMLDSINPKFSNFFCVITLHGTPFSSMSVSDMTSTFMNRSKDAYIFHDNIHYFIMSNDTTSTLQKSVGAFRSTLKQYFETYSAGISLIHAKMEIETCFDEAAVASDTAIILNEEEIEYDNSSLLQLVLKIKDVNALNNYHDCLILTINAYKSENDTTLFDTLREYVRCRGSYHDTAVSMGQHESTIRYRINRLREILNLQDDIIQFHACIALLAIIDEIMPKN